MKIKSIKGIHDVTPDQSGRWRAFEQTAREIFDSFGFAEIRVPILEKTELFARSLGADTDVVGKEMYTFNQDDSESVTLRPEGTAGVVRSAIEHNLFQGAPSLRLYYIGPMFRRERPQKGRYRQFHQVGAECFGSESPLADVEMIQLQLQLLKRLAVSQVTLEINSIGCTNDDCRPAYRETLVGFLQNHAEKLCEDCRRRTETNPLRTFDCKVESCREVMKEAPLIVENICPDCAANFVDVQSLLAGLGVEYEINPRIVRGLDYYTRTVWEISSGELGSQSAVSAGGRYDGLVSELDGPKTPAVGFALGVERLLLLADEAALKPLPPLDLFVLFMTGGKLPVAGGAAADLAETVRSAGFSVGVNYEAASFKSGMKRADKSGARYTAILGDDEIAAGVISLKDMQTGEQEKLTKEQLIERLGLSKTVERK